MRFPARYLQPPVCVFNRNEECLGGDERFRALRKFGPYDAGKAPSTPRLLFVFPDEFRSYANQIYHGLQTGNNQFPGMEAMFGIKVSREELVRTQKFTIQGMPRQRAAEVISRVIRDSLESKERPDFAVVICQKTAHWETPSPYYAAKATLASYGVPSQVVTVDLLSNQNQLIWSLANIGLQVFVKLGGHPWFVRPSPGGGDIVVGIGRSERTNTKGEVTRYVGYTTAYTSGGVFKSVEIFTPQRSFDDYLERFQDSVSQSLKRTLGNPAQPVRLVLHVPKRFSREEKKCLEAALQEVKDKVAGYVVLRVNDEHPFHLFDLDHKSMAPLSGLSVEIDERNRLLLLEGRPTTGSMRRSPPSPLWVTHQVSSISNVNLDVLVQQIYELSVANWRGFNAKARPITTYYSQLIARILSASEGNEIVEAISASDSLRNVPWFI